MSVSNKIVIGINKIYLTDRHTVIVTQRVKDVKICMY